MMEGARIVDVVAVKDFQRPQGSFEKGKVYALDRNLAGYWIAEKLCKEADPPAKKAAPETK